ncbi:PREDICTED: cullin-associated NEDD8-dissociated protein 1-like [Acromyrmex echinatior]|uniref:cullin-associated NEDD8-dissociated protein 1-like n=1 Tax=Acromyrmex echinatior TaxID=103372 RepID=UPI000580F00B|nr:PREDICTED: cullin-associated NEDD8-dissociated protein 1-like [Acromyrmex echinatior]
MLEFFQALVQANLPELGYRDLLSMLIVSVTSSLLHEQAYHSLAKYAATLTIPWHNEAQCIVQQLLKDVQNPSECCTTHICFVGHWRNRKTCRFKWN